MGLVCCLMHSVNKEKRKINLISAQMNLKAQKTVEVKAWIVLPGPVSLRFTDSVLTGRECCRFAVIMQQYATSEKASDLLVLTKSG